MLGKLKVWFLALSTAGKVGTVAAASIIGIAAASSGSTPQLVQKCTPISTVSYSNQAQDISFKNTDISDSTLPKGTTKINTPGVNGQEIIKDKVVKYTPSGCKPDDYIYVSTTRVKEPVNQVTNVGSYVAPAPEPTTTPTSTQTDCPNGTYVNSAGNTVCSPYSSPSAPVGATAQCVDGTYSFSQSRSGTCSHHGGVAQWL